MSFTSKPLVRFACRSSLVLTRCFSSVTFVVTGNIQKKTIRSEKNLRAAIIAYSHGRRACIDLSVVVCQRVGLKRHVVVSIGKLGMLVSVLRCQYRHWPLIDTAAPFLFCRSTLPFI